MLDGTDDTLSAAVKRWLGEFEDAIRARDVGALQKLFRTDGYWRDLLALTWDIRTVCGGNAIASALADRAETAAPSGFEIDSARTPPRPVIRAGEDAIEAIFRFDTADGPASGVLRLSADGAEPVAWTLLTARDGIAGFTEAVGDARPTGEVYSRDFRGPNWLDRRLSAAAYEDRDPAVLVVGGGQAGLSIAARLTQLGIDTLIVDREQRIGDNWRKRYHALTLHNQVHVNHLPYMPFPPSWPAYIPKDKIANWFEAYAESMELNFWTETEFAGGSYDARGACWSVSLRCADGTAREMRPRHVVMATGVSGIPNRPDIPGLGSFGGTVLHSSGFDRGEEWAGSNVVIIGSGNSGHDIAQDLHSHGASVTLVQRSPTTIVNVEPSAQLPYALYGEGPPLEDCDLSAAATPFPVMRQAHRLITEQTKVLDRNLLDRLSRVGFRMDFGADDTGWQFKYLERGGGYYFNVGCSDLVADGEIGLVQYADIDRVVSDGIRLRNGETLPAGLIVLATGYRGLDELVAKLFGDEVAGRVGPIWGFDAEQAELRNMFVRTGQPGLWFIAGSFAQCRIYSKYLGLQIKACEAGIISPVR